MFKVELILTTLYTAGSLNASYSVSSLSCQNHVSLKSHFFHELWKTALLSSSLSPLHFSANPRGFLNCLFSLRRRRIFLNTRWNSLSCSLSHSHSPRLHNFHKREGRKNGNLVTQPMTKVVRKIEVQYLSLRCTGVEVNGCTKWKYSSTSNSVMFLSAILEKMDFVVGSLIIIIFFHYMSTVGNVILGQSHELEMTVTFCIFTIQYNTIQYHRCWLLACCPLLNFAFGLLVGAPLPHTDAD